MMRPAAGCAKPYFGADGVGVAAEGVGDGVAGVAASSIFKTRPAGVRRASMGVVSGVGGGGAVLSAPPWVSAPWGLPPQPAIESAAKTATASPNVKPTRGERLMR
jgi:hypothetical protein